MKDSTTYDFAEEMGDVRKFLCRCVQSAINSLSARLVQQFRWIPSTTASSASCPRAGTS